ncbi:MAG TPA: 6-carboxytetrahydropterin synthase QueD [Clostridiales bacterium]|nr:MAG: 6-carboxytetrahydropterin synthase QueD [Clostridiales bacterium GWD2_32_59]HAN09625.1 6-carboxytetrahydropterin synthase QueD [Clostridiales bacterium]
MVEITKEFTFDAAHMLEGHDGLCKNVHGHTYKLQVTLNGDLKKEVSSEGMIIDFKDLKNMVKEYVIELFDHSFIYNIENEKEKEIGSFLESKGLKTCSIKGRSTCENLVGVIFHKLNINNENISSIRLWETPTSFSEYRNIKKTKNDKT